MRKRYGVILAVIGIIVFFFCMEGWGADWRKYAHQERYDSFYDAETITNPYPSKDIVRVWVRLDASTKWVKELVSKHGAKFDTLSYVKELKEIDCADKKSQVLQEYQYSKEGKLLGTSIESLWRYFVTGSGDDFLYKRVCKSSQAGESPVAEPAQSKVKYPVIGSDSNEVFKGFVEMDKLPTSTSYIEVESQTTKSKCTGHAVVTYNPDARNCKGARGIAKLECTDGRIINAEYICSECRKGKGTGYDQKGNKFAFVFGLTEAEAIKYFDEELTIASKEPDSSSTYKPQETRKEKGFSTGTGFFVSTDGYLITNSHVIEDSQKVIVITLNKTVLEAEIIKTDPANDVALLKVKATTKPLPFSDQGNLSQGEAVFALGYPLIMMQGQEQKATFGRINSLTGIGDDIRFIQIDVPIQSGNSGSPLINMNGQVIGVVTATLDQVATLKASGNLPQNVNYALKSDYVVPLLRHYLGNMPSKRPTTQGTQKIEDLIKLAKPSVVLIIAK